MACHFYVVKLQKNRNAATGANHKLLLPSLFFLKKINKSNDGIDSLGSNFVWGS
jgi:hypothetical protein